MTRIHGLAAHAARILLVAGVLALAYAGYVVIDAHTYQVNEQRRFAEDGERVPTASVPVEGDAIGEIGIPRLGIAAIVAEGDSAATLRRAVGHVVDTAWPGETGNVVLAGHRDTFFRPLKDVRVGDTITMKTRGGDFEYRVESIRVVRPTDVQVLASTGGRTLTLITCFPFFYLGPAPDRLIVVARAVTAAAR